MVSELTNLRHFAAEVERWLEHGVDDTFEYRVQDVDGLHTVKIARPKRTVHFQTVDALIRLSALLPGGEQQDLARKAIKQLFGSL